MIAKASRRRFLALFSAGAVTSLWSSASGGHGPGEWPDAGNNPEAWRGRVSPEAWKVLFREATERPYSSPLNDEKRDGWFICAACYLPLFESRWKYDSRTGWPSFYDADREHLGFKTDYKLIYPRTEYHCARCGGHQGHVFEDGPEPTGLRYCNNGLALRFVEAGAALPDLRSAS